MNIYDFLFIVCFLLCCSIMLYKFYNILNQGLIYNLNITWVLFVGGLLSFFTCFTIFMLQPERLIYAYTFNVLALVNYLNIFFLIVELLFYFKVFSPKGTQAYKSNSVNGSR